MFIAVGVGVSKDRDGYVAVVDYFDDRVTPRKKIGTSKHPFKDKADLAALVQLQLTQLLAADQMEQLHAQIAGVTIATIDVDAKVSSALSADVVP